MKSVRERQISYHLHVELKNSANELTYKTKALKDIENKLKFTNEERGKGIN